MAKAKANASPEQIKFGQLLTEKIKSVKLPGGKSLSRQCLAERANVYLGVSEFNGGLSGQNIYTYETGVTIDNKKLLAICKVFEDDFHIDASNLRDFFIYEETEVKNDNVIRNNPLDTFMIQPWMLDDPDIDQEELRTNEHDLIKRLPDFMKKNHLVPDDDMLYYLQCEYLYGAGATDKLMESLNISWQEVALIKKKYEEYMNTFEPFGLGREFWLNTSCKWNPKHPDNKRTNYKPLPNREHHNKVVEHTVMKILSGVIGGYFAPKEFYQLLKTVQATKEPIHIGRINFNTIRPVDVTTIDRENHRAPEGEWIYICESISGDGYRSYGNKKQLNIVKPDWFLFIDRHLSLENRVKEYVNEDEKPVIRSIGSWLNDHGIKVNINAGDWYECVDGSYECYSSKVTYMGEEFIKWYEDLHPELIKEDIQSC